MLEKLQYINHKNEVIDFGTEGIYVNIGDLRDYQWETTTRNHRISRLTYGIQKRSLPVIIICASDEDGRVKANRMFEVFEKDCLALQHGRIVLGGYYFRCYVTGSSKAQYLYTKRYLELKLTLESDFPYWVKETTSRFSKQGAELLPDADAGINGTNPGSPIDSALYLDYPYDYPYEYTNVLVSNSVFNTNFVPSNFRLTFYGPCSNPSVTIADHIYRVNCNVGEGQYLVVDSVDKTVRLYDADGSFTSKFGDRNKDSYIFEPIPVGNCDLSWSGSYLFDVTILEERSEPKWT